MRLRVPTGIATGAHAVLIPEQPASLESLQSWLQSARSRGEAPMVIVAEGYKPLGDHETLDDPDGGAGAPQAE